MENSLMKINEEIKITSVELIELINNFRKEEGNYKEKKHDDLLKSIRNEIETLKNFGIVGVGNFSESSYTNKQNKQQPCYLLNKAGVLEMLNKESAIVRYKTVQYIEKLEKEKNKSKLPQTYKEALIELVASIEENERLQLENKEKQKEIEYKSNVIKDMSKEITLAEKQQRINQIVKHNTNNYRDRWHLLYSEFNKRYHCDISKRFNNAKERGEIKKSTSKVEYVCKVMDKTNELYEICVKLFEGDFLDMLDEWKETIEG